MSGGRGQVAVDRDGCGRSRLQAARYADPFPRRVPGKRGLDLLVAAAALVFAAPAMLVIAWLIRREDGPPALFRQERIGRHGRSFTILKFRTMRRDPDPQGRQVTIGRDRRVTRIGACLRASRLDELPQLINILRGDMHLVGLRPEVPRYVAGYSPRHRRMLTRRPGLTDPASLAFSDEAALLARAPDGEDFYLRRLMPAKVERALRFAAGETLGWDLRILLRTLCPRRRTR
ncbi:MAG: sugar transferase [Planctomycetota bacterium]